MKSALSLRLILAMLPACILAFTACDDDTSSIGSSLVTDRSEITVDSTFTLTGRSVATNSFRARTLTQLLGSIDARSYGTLTSDYVTQLMPSEQMDTTGVSEATIDSLKLILRFYSDKITGDSMTPMGVKVFQLNRQLPAKLSSDFSPAGYYDPSSPIASTIYASNTLYSDSLEHMGVHVIEANLPLELGRRYFRAYKENPAAFASPELFADLFPGIYVANSFGSGRVTNIFNTRATIYFHANTRYTNSADEERDTTIYYARVIAASTPEVLTNNNVTFRIDPSLTALAAKAPLMVAPLGYETEITMPVNELIASYRNATQKAMGVVNSLSLSIPAEKIANSYGIEPPAQVLLIPVRDRDKFFDEQQTPDYVTSYIATYDYATGAYTFSSMRPYIMHAIEHASDPEELQAIARMAIVPVEVTSETYTNSSYQQVEIVTAVGPYIEGPAMARLRPEDAKIKLTYSTETINF